MKPHSAMSLREWTRRNPDLRKRENRENRVKIPETSRESGDAAPPDPQPIIITPVVVDARGGPGGRENQTS
jgi:hypothetical protein